MCLQISAKKTILRTRFLHKMTNKLIYKRILLWGCKIISRLLNRKIWLHVKTPNPKSTAEDDEEVAESGKRTRLGKFGPTMIWIFWRNSMCSKWTRKGRKMSNRKNTGVRSKMLRMKITMDKQTRQLRW